MSTNSVFQTPSGAEVIHPHLVYFVVPLAEPLALPDKYRVECGAATARNQFLEAQESGRPMPRPGHLAASMVFHQVGSSSSSFADVDDLLALATGVLPRPAGEAPATAGKRAAVDLPGRERTFVEVALACDLSEDGVCRISDAFDQGLGLLRELQRAYYLVRRQPMRLVTREVMPFAVPFGVRRLFDESGAPLPFEVSLSLFFLNQGMCRDFRGPDFTDDDVEQFRVSLKQQSYGGFLTDYLEFVRETEVALHLDGSYRAAVLFAATSCEVLFDNLLAHMLWEEGSRPEDVAGLFASGRDGITARVKKHYHPRVGGQWSVDQPGAIRNWFTQVAGLRNRVVHGGYDPSFAEATDASRASAALAAYLGDLLAGRTKDYPRTALVLPGRPGIERRGKWHRRLQDLQDDPAQVNWVATFASWQAAMQRASPDSPLYVAPTSDGAWVYAVLVPDGGVRWVVRDPAAGYAALVDPAAVQGMTPKTRASLNASHAERLAGGVKIVTSTVFNHLAVPEPAPRDWRLQYRLLPLLGVMVDGSDLDP